MRVRSLAAVLMAAALVGAPQFLRAEESAGEITAPSLVIFRMDGRSYGLEDLKAMAEIHRPGFYSRMPAERIAALRGEPLLEYLTEVGVMREAAELARARNMTIEGRPLANIESRVDNAAKRYIYRTQIAPRIGEPTEKELRDFYEINLENLYTQREEMVFRTIFLSTYKTHVVQEGETLRSIARDVSGDESLFVNILSEETKRPRIEFLDPPASAEEIASANLTPLPEGAEPVPPRALTVGEELLVPMPPHEMAEVEGRAQKVLARLAAGEPFDQVARDFSQNERPGAPITYRPGTDRPILRDLENTLRSLQPQTYSQPVRTRHGLHIVFLERYTEGRPRTFEEVVEDIRNRDLRRRQNDGWNEWFLEQVKARQENLKIDWALYASEEKSDLDPIVTLQGETINRADFDAGLNRLPGYSPEVNLAELPRERLLEMLSHHGVLRNAIFRLVIAEQDILSKPEITELRRALEDEVLGSRYLAIASDEAVGQPTEEELLAHYRENEHLWRVPAKADVLRIYMPVLDEDADKAEVLRKLEHVKSTAKTEEQFSEASGELGRGMESLQPMPSVPPGTMRGILMDSLPGNVSAELRAAAPGTIVGPLEVDRGYALYWLIGITEGRVPPLDEIRSGVVQHWRDARIRERNQTLRAELVAKLNIQIPKRPE